MKQPLPEPISAAQLSPKMLAFCSSPQCLPSTWRLLVSSVTSLVAQTVKRLSTMQETRVRSLGRDDPLEKEMAIHSSAIAWKIPWTEEAGRLQSTGLLRVMHD